MSTFTGHKTNDFKQSTEIISWCRYVKATELNQQGVRIGGIRMCQYGEKNCRGAHRIHQMSTPQYITDWNTMDKSNINILSIRDNIIETITRGKDTVVNPKYSSVIHTITKMNLDDLMIFWYDITCFHRKIAKELPNKRGFKGSVQPDIVHGYRYREDVPQFKLNDEDIVWALERTLHCCTAHRATMDRSMVHPFFSICCGGDKSCKFGEHSRIAVACIESLVTGSCHCLSIEQIESEKTRIATLLNSYDKQLVDSVDADGFQVKLSKKVRDSIMMEKQKLESILPTLVRGRHYCDEGLISLAQRIAEAEETKKVAKVVDVEKMEVKSVVKVVKKKY